MIKSSKPRIGISSCLLGEKVRYDGQHKRDAFLMETLGRFVEWVPVCPELEVGMGIPREPVRLVGNSNNPRLMGEKSGKDWTDSLKEFSTQRVKQLQAMNLSGYVLKKKSPSCGMERVKVYGKKGIPFSNGRGIFATVLSSNWPLLPMEEEGRMNQPRLRENFIERVFAYERWHTLVSERKSRGSIILFHSQNKFLIVSHSDSHMRRLGRLLGSMKKQGVSEVYKEYGNIFMEALAVPATVRKHTNVLQHMLGYFSEKLTSPERKELLEVIEDFRKGWVPLIVPITLIRHYVRKYEVYYLMQQVYLQPHPKELMLRNHV